MSKEETTVAQPPIAVTVRVVWRPDDFPEPAGSPVSTELPAPTVPPTLPPTLPVQLFQLLQPHQQVLTSERSGMPVFLHTAVADASGIMALPPDVPTPAGEQTLVVVFVGEAMLNDSAWMKWVRALRRRIGDIVGAEFLPIALTERALLFGHDLGEFNADRAFDDSSPIERDRGVRITVLRTLARMLNGGQKIHSFVSHAKTDGSRVGKVLAATLDQLNAEAWIDVEQIEAGRNFRQVLATALDRDSVFVAVVSDAYATREWCRWEAQIAKERGLAMVVLDMVTEGQRRSVPALGNVPVIRFNAPIVDDDAPPSVEAIVACRRVIEAVLLERVNSLYFARRVQKLGAQFAAAVDEWTVFSPAPDLISLVCRRAQLALSNVAVYPDPPLPSFESEMLRSAVAGARLETPLSLLPELAARSLGGGGVAPRPLRVAISISKPPAGELLRAAMSDYHVDALFLAACRFLLAAGHTLAYGGDPLKNFTEALGDIERTYRFTTEDDEERRLVNYVAGYLHRAEAFTGEMADVMEIVKVSPAPVEAGGEALIPLNDLTVMRRRMTAETDVRIIAAGDLTPGSPGSRRGPGVLEESYLAMEAGQPLLVIGGFGGAGRLLVDALLGRSDANEIDRLRGHFASKATLAVAGEPFAFDDMLGGFSPASRLNNRLSDDENLRLAVSTDLDEIAALIVLATHRIGTT